MKPFEIFRTGNHTSSQGANLTFSDDDLAAIAAGYDPELSEAPIVVGHPKEDAPAYGWVKSLKVHDGRLVAEVAQVEPTFSEMVKGGRFKKRSAAFYSPGSASNPTPGKYYLRHVGFLGAQPPAVKGLKEVAFAEVDMLVEFSDLSFDEWRNAWAFENVARLFRGLRDYFIESASVETADKLLPQWDLDQLTQAAADSRAEARVEASPRTFSETPEETTMTKTAEQLQAELDAREAAIKAREATFAENAKNIRKAEDKTFVASIVSAGRLPVGLQNATEALFSELGDGELTFGEGDEAVKTSPRQAFRDLLSALPTPVSAGELAKGDGPDFSDPAYVQAAIETEIRDASQKGEKLSPAAAAMRLKARG